MPTETLAASGYLKPSAKEGRNCREFVINGVNVKPELRIEDMIYEAATDLRSFEGLASVLADALGARSGVLHWRSADDLQEVSYSGYFPTEAMDQFSRSFADADLWSDAVNQPSAAGRIWNLEELVSRETYASSRIYNEWIRPMGDDTFHCLGGTIQAGAFLAELGFHRGRAQRPFDEEQVRWANSQLGHLRRMLTIRHKLAAAEGAQAAVTAGLDVIGYAILLLKPDGTLVHANRAGEAMLRRGDGLKLRGGRVRASSHDDDRKLLAAFARCGARGGVQAGALLVGRRSGGSYEVSLTPTSMGDSRHIMLIAHDPAAADTSVAGRLRTLYGLTPAEAEVALGLAGGASLSDLAERRGTSIDTVRAQVKAALGKLGCRRQSELVSVVRNLPILNLG